MTDNIILQFLAEIKRTINNLSPCTALTGEIQAIESSDDGITDYMMIKIKWADRNLNSYEEGKIWMKRAIGKKVVLVIEPV